MSGLQIERFGPFVYAALVVLLWWWLLEATFPSQFDTLMAVTGTVAAVLMGFLSTAKAIVLGLTGTEVFRRLKNAGYHNDLNSYIRAAVYASMILLVLSLAGLFIEQPLVSTAAKSFAIAFPYIWMYFASFAAFTFLRVINNLFKLIRQV